MHTQHVSEMGELLRKEALIQASFIYPEWIRAGVVLCEDIENAIIQYLVKGGFDEEKLLKAKFSFEQCPDGEFIIKLT